MTLAKRMLFSQDPATTLNQGGAWYQADLELPAGTMTVVSLLKSPVGRTLGYLLYGHFQGQCPMAV